MKQLYIDTNGNVILGGDSQISWENVTGTGHIATQSYVTSQGYQNASQVTTITKDTVTTSYVNALNVTAKDVSADWIYAGNIKAGQIKTGIITSTDGVSTVINLDNGTFNIGKNALTWDGSALSVTGTIHSQKAYMISPYIAVLWLITSIITKCIGF